LTLRLSACAYDFGGSLRARKEKVYHTTKKLSIQEVGIVEEQGKSKK
jgi:hypothetical protein